MWQKLRGWRIRGQALSTAWGDFDGDGWPDLYACNFTEPNVLFRNQGDGAFADQTAAAGVGADYIDGFITFVLDYDNDGALDIFVGNWSQYPVVLADRVAGKSTSERDRPVLFRNQGRRYLCRCDGSCRAWESAGHDEWRSRRCG